MASSSIRKLFPAVKRLTEFVVTSGSGCSVRTQCGRTLLDFTSGIGVTSTGHCHPAVVEAVREQAGSVVHAQMSVVHHDKMLALVEKLEPLMPHPSLDSFFFANSGSEAVESALRLARHATGKDSVIAFSGGYHGRTSGALAVTSSQTAYRGTKASMLPGGTFFAPYPYELLGMHRSTEVVMGEMELMLKTMTSPSETAAVIIEPVLGEGGYYAAPPEFMRLLRDFCDRHGILLIADEVQSGFGRTGKMFAVEHSETRPDIMVMAKGIASGYPLSAIVCSSDLSNRQAKGCMGGTYGGNAVSCAAALATLDVFEREKILDNVTR